MLISVLLGWQVFFFFFNGSEAFQINSVTFNINGALRKQCHILPCLYRYLAHQCLWSTLVIGEFPGGSVVENLSASAEDRDSIPGLERSSLKFEEMAAHFSIFAWRIPWTGEPGRLQPMGLQRVGCTKKRVQFGG